MTGPWHFSISGTVWPGSFTAPGTPTPVVNLSGTLTQSADQDGIVSGGYTLILTAAGTTWIPTIGADNSYTTGLLAGIVSAQSETYGWDNVVSAGLTYEHVTRTSDTVVTITLPAFANYAITANETLTATIPADNLENATEALVASNTVQIDNVVEAVALTGTLTTAGIEASVVDGGLTLIFTLTGDQWVATLGADNAITTAFLDGITSAQSETYGWNNVVRDNLTYAALTRDNATQATLTLPAAATYSITVNETITATIPASALVASSSQIVATPTVDVTQTSCSVSGTVTTAEEANIVAGGRTLVLTLAGAGISWETSVGDDNAVTTALIGGIDSAQSEGTGWNDVVQAGLTYANVVRTDSTTVTITLPAFASYDITADETITVTVPASAVSGSAAALTAAPTFQVLFRPTIAITGTGGSGLTELEVLTGSETLIFTVTDDEFVATLGADNAITTAFLAGITAASSPTHGWNNEVSLDYTMLTRDNATQCTLTLPATAAYEVTADETITAIVPTSALSSSQLAVTATPTVTVGHAAVAITGTGASGMTEQEVIDGSETLIFTVSNDEWVATLGADNAITTAFLAGIDGDGSGAGFWDDEVKASLTYAMLTRNSATQCTLVLPAAASYEGAETVTCTMPASALVGSSEAIVATPTISVSVPTSALITEDFEDTSYTSRGWYDVSTVANSTSEQRTGAACIEFEFDVSDQSPNGGLGRHLFTASDDITLDYWVKYSSNWEGSGVGYHPHEFYILTDADSAYVGPASATLEVLIESHHNGSTGSYMQIGIGPSGHPGEQLVTSAVVLTDAEGDNYKGDWHHIQAHLAMNSSVGVADGVAQLWFDSELVIDNSVMEYRARAGEDSMLFNQLLVAPYIGVGSPANQTMWLDDFDLYGGAPTDVYATPDIVEQQWVESDWGHLDQHIYGASDPTGLNNGVCERSTAQAYQGTYAAHIQLPSGADHTSERVISMGVNWSARQYDQASAQSYDAIYVAFWLYATNYPDTQLKFLRHWSNPGTVNNGGLFFGLGANDDYLYWGWDQEAGATNSPGWPEPWPLNAWHHIEYHYVRNGYTYPRVGFWYDGSPIWPGYPNDPGAGWELIGSHYYLDAGARGSSLGLSFCGFCDIMNATNTNGVIDYYVDGFAVSTARIGPGTV